MSERSELSLKYFYIYNNNYGQLECEEEQKILYYFPPKVSGDEKMRNVGLSEAIMQFTQTFNQNQPCESLHTLKSRHYYYSPEANFFMVMCVNVPSSTSIEGTAYHGEEVQDTVCLAVMRQVYLMYRLFHNTFSSLLEASDGNTTPLKEKLEVFFNKHLSSLQLHSCDILNIFQGVQFLPLDKQTFLHVQCFINLLEASFPVIDLSVFLYNDRLIWSGLEPEDMQVVFHHLVHSLLPRHQDPTPPTTTLPKTPLAASFTSNGRFITGPENVHTNTNNVGRVPKLVLSHVKPSPRIYHFVVYKTSNCTVCLFIPESEQLTMEMFRRWDTFLGPRLPRLEAEVGAFTSRPRQCTGVQSDTTVARFLYFNRMNLATKSTIHVDARRSGNFVVTPQVLRILANINSDHTRSLDESSPSAETIVKTTADYWVVGQLSNAREFYVVIQQKNANLIEINDEVKRICDNELKSIFFHV